MLMTTQQVSALKRLILSQELVFAETVDKIDVSVGLEEGTIDVQLSNPVAFYVVDENGKVFS